jgi:spermidine synthase
MNVPILSFALPASLLVAARLGLYLSRRRGYPLFEEKPADPQPWSLPHLLVASFLTLFAELAFIRWIAVEVRVFAYFKNLALLLCFVGFGLGCALVNERIRWSAALKSFLGLVLIIRLPWSQRPLERLSQNLGAAGDLNIWAAGSQWRWLPFCTAALLAGALFLLIVVVFIPLGQIVSRQMNAAPRPLSGYSWNLFGSLLGILAFLAVSRMMLPPVIWLSAVLLGFALLQTERRERVLVIGLIAPLVLLLRDPTQRDGYIVWTPYQQIQYSRYYTNKGDFSGGWLRVNHTGYQSIVNLSSWFLARYPGALSEPVNENPYNLPFRFAVPQPSVLIVGSGSGNDVAGALRNDSRAVDAVEIDPAILEIGRREHPERPYDSPRVSIYITDARRFLKRSTVHYDLILFGLLDSHTQFSDYSNMRIDNFVYTEQSFREAMRHLNPDGIIFVKFQVNRPWMAQRIAEMLRRVFGKSPVVFKVESSYSASATCFAISAGDRVEESLAADPRLAQFVKRTAIALDSREVPITTDDWPYLYHEGRWIPRTYYSVGLLVLLIAAGLYSQITANTRRLPSLFFFAMGAGFLLLETQLVSRLALFFGTIWQVNGIVISALLLALLLANMLVERSKDSLQRPWVFGALLAGLAVAYLIPFDRIPVSPGIAGLIAAAVFAMPVVCAGILFALEFQAVDSPSAALGANILGAVAGGLLENLSLVIGMRALLLVAMGLYCLAGIGLWRRWRSVSISDGKTGIRLAHSASS